MKDSYTSNEIEEITGVKRLRLHQWVGMGLLRPSVHQAGGSGDINLYSFEDVVQAATIKKLTEAGFSRRLIKRLLQPFEKCPNCGELFLNPTERRKVYCSQRCQNAAGVRRTREKQKRMTA